MVLASFFLVEELSVAGIYKQGLQACALPVLSICRYVVVIVRAKCSSSSGGLFLVYLLEVAAEVIGAMQ